MTRNADNDQDLDVRVREVIENKQPDGAVYVTFETTAGRLNGLYHPVEDAVVGVVLLGGAGGGLDGPASSYSDLASKLLAHGMASLRLDYRRKTQFEDSVVDAFIGIQYLTEQGIDSVGIVGWSFGGPVAISAAAVHENVKAVATVATQSAGTEGAGYLDGKPILLLHGTGDKSLPVSCSRNVYDLANEPKELRVFESAGHGLEQVRDEMVDALCEFFVKNLGEG